MSSTAIHNMFTEEELAEIITTQKKCFMRKCSHKCSKCLYHQNPERIIAAYNQILDLLATQKSIKREFFSSGIEYAKAEFYQILKKEREKVDKGHKNKRISDLAYIQTLGLQRAMELIDEVAR